MPETTDRTPPTAPRPRLQPSFAALLALLALALTGASLATVEAGDALVDEGLFAEAIAVYQQVIDERPDDARAHYRLARASVYRADSLPDGDDDAKQALFDLAASHATRATRLAPDDADAHFEVARALGRQAQYRGVLASLNLASRVASALDRALELDPEHAGAWHARALYHHEVPWIAGGRSGLVLPAFRRAIDIEPDVIAHRLELAKVLMARGDEAAAAEALRVAVTLIPRTYLDRQDLEEARGLLDGVR